MSIDSASSSSLLSLEVILGKISEITLQLQQCKEVESILQGAIADIRELLQTDRVLIYRFLEERSAVVAFESVGTEWTSILGQTIYDPCLDAWVKRYEQEQTKTTAIANVRSGTIDCYVQLLERLDVQAHLVVPIFSQATLWGLLVVHQYCSPREWQPLEIQLLQHIAVQLGLVVQQAKLYQHQQYLEIQLERQTIDCRQAIIPFKTALQESEDRFRQLLDSTPVLIWMSGVDGLCNFLNQNWLGFIGRTRAHEMVNGWAEAVHPDDQQRCLEIYQTAFKACQPLEIEYRLRRADRVYRWVLDRGVARFTSDGEFAGYIDFCLDIHDRKQKEELIQNSEALLRRYERIVSATPDCVSLLDRNYIYQIINQTYLNWHRKSYDDIAGQSVSDLLGQEFFETISKPALDRCLTGETEHTTIKAWHDYADGHRRFFKASYAPYLEPDSTISGVVVNVHDVTDLKLAEEALQESEERFRQMATSIHEVFWMADIDFTKIIYVSPVYEDLWGRSCTSLYEQPESFLESIHPEDRDRVLAIVERRRRTDFSYEYRLVRPDGTIRWVWERTFPVVDKTGNPYRLVGVSLDISERKAAEFALAESHQKYQNLIENSPDIIERFDLQLRHLYVSPALSEITGIPVEVFLGKTCRELGMNEAMVETWEAAASALLVTGQKQVLEFETPTLQGVRSFEMAIVPELSKHLTIESILCISRDISDRKVAEARLLHQVYYDSLTGLPNRALFMERLDCALEQVKRKGEYAFAVLFLDLDRFKVVNDSLGHVMGDRLLIAFACRLKACLRAGDTIARLGGDEFTILLEGFEDVSYAIDVADRIQAELTLPFNLGSLEVFTTASIGIALNMKGYEKPEEILRDADNAMYCAKSLGKARYEIFNSDMHAQAVALLQIETELRRAIAHQEFRLHYQPIVSLLTGKITGFEALIRWQHPQRGLLLPGQFMPIAIETELSIPIDEWVMHEACRQIKLWQQLSSNGVLDVARLTISVNVCKHGLKYEHLLPQISQVLQETGLDASSLKLEITEDVIMEHGQRVTQKLNLLRSLGIHLEIDDFGTGYSSLARLHGFPINGFKIDRSFISGNDEYERNRAIVETIVTLAQKLDIQVTAEGVETAEQLALLREFKCEFGQGYFFSKPLSTQAAEALLMANSQW